MFDNVKRFYVRYSNSWSLAGRLALLLALVSRWEVWQANVPTWVALCPAALCTTFVFAMWPASEASVCTPVTKRWWFKGTKI